MDRLVAEVETKKEKVVEEKTVVLTEDKTEEKIEIFETPMQETENEKYLNSFENMTVADFKKQEEEKRIKEFQLEKEKLIEKQFEKEEAPQQDQKEEKVFKQEVSQNIIEKPNYDFIQESDKVVKLSRKENAKKKPRKKRLSLFLSIALGISAIICVSNVIAIDQMSSNLAGIEYELYEVNLPKYLKDIADLDTTKKGMEFIETFPEEEFDAGEAGKKSNWFDKLCNFFSGLFGG